jgi:hypothetical protein
MKQLIIETVCPDCGEWDVTDILTGLGLVEWMLWNDPDNRDKNRIIAQRAARWACALHEADFLLETSTVKDLGVLLMDGHKGFKSMVDVADYVATLVEENTYKPHEISERARARTAIAIEFQAFLRNCGFYIGTSQHVKAVAS